MYNDVKQCTHIILCIIITRLLTIILKSAWNLKHRHRRKTKKSDINNCVNNINNLFYFLILNNFIYVFFSLTISYVLFLILSLKGVEILHRLVGVFSSKIKVFSIYINQSVKNVILKEINQSIKIVTLNFFLQNEGWCLFEHLFL